MYCLKGTDELMTFSLLGSPRRKNGERRAKQDQSVETITEFLLQIRHVTPVLSNVED